MTAQHREPIGVAGVPGAALPTRLAGATTSGHPTTGTWQANDLVVDGTGQLWLCTVAGPPAQWVNVSAPNVAPTLVWFSVGLGPQASVSAYKIFEITHSGGGTVELPSPADNGTWVTLKVTDNGVYTVIPNVSETIEGGATDTISGVGTSKTYVSDGTNWIVFNSYVPPTALVRSYEVNVDLITHDQAVNTMTSGSFVAVSTQAIVNVSIASSMLGNAQGAFWFILGAANQARPLLDHTGAVTGGSTKFFLPNAWGDQGQGCVARRFLASSLTPGATYNWEIWWGVVGGSYDAGPLGTEPFQIALRSGVTQTYTITGVTFSGKTITATVASTLGLAVGAGVWITGITGFTTNNPNGYYTITATTATTITYTTTLAAPTGTYASGGSFNVVKRDIGFMSDLTAASGSPQVFPVILGGRGAGNLGGSGNAFSNAGNFQPYGVQILGGITSTLTSPCGIAVTPDGTRVVCGSEALTGGNSGNALLVVIDADTLAVLHTWTGTNVVGAGVASGAFSIVCDNTYAYLLDYFSNSIYKVNINTGASTKLALAAGPRQGAITPDFTKIVVGLGNGTVLIINTNTGTTSAPTLNTTVNLVGQNVTGTGAVTSSTLIQACVIQKNGTYAWVTCGGGTRDTLFRITIATGAFTGYDTLGQSGYGFGGIDISTMWFTGPTYVSQNWTSQSIPTGFDGQQFVGPINMATAAGVTSMGGVAIDSQGWIYVPTDTHGHLWVWPGGRLQCLAGADTQVPGNCSVMIEGVV